MSPEQPQQPADPLTSTPGKIRTWWHPLLTNLLRWQLEPIYQVLEEVPVGKKPLQIDILLLSKGSGELSADARRLLAGLADYLNQYTLVEFKGPTDTLRAGDFRTFLAYAHLYCAHTAPLLEPRFLNLLVVAPRLTFVEMLFAALLARGIVLSRRAHVRNDSSRPREQRLSATPYRETP